MRIERLRIDAFGQFRQFELRLSSGLNLLVGPNEAGKSTLLAFVRSMLFGFERRGDPGRYEPIDSALGGELVLSTSAGPIWVRRMASARRTEGELSIRSGSGERLPSWRLAEALSGASRGLFCQVFAFGLQELSSFRELSSQGSVSEALFVAGMEGARRLPKALTLLRKSCDSLFSPRGTKPELNRQLAALANVRHRLSHFGDRPAQYFASRQELQELDRRAAEVAELASELDRKRDALERVCATFVDLDQLGALEAELAELPNLEDFPEDGMARFEALRSRLREVRAEVARWTAEQSSAQQALSQLPPALTPERIALLRAAVSEFNSRRERSRSLGGRRVALEEKRAQLLSGLEALGAWWTPDKLRQGRFAPGDRTTLEQLRERLLGDRHELANAQQRWRLAVGSRERIEAFVQKLRLEASGLPDVTASELSARHAALSRILAMRERVLRLEAAERQKRMELEADQRAEVATDPLLFKRVAVAGFGIILVCIIAAFWQLGAAAGSAAVLFGACTISLVVAARWRSGRRLRRARAERHARRSRMFDEAEAAGALCHEARIRLATLEQAAQVAQDHTDRQIQEIQESALSQLQRALERDRIAKELSEQSAALAEAELEERNASEDVAACQLRIDGLDRTRRQVLDEIAFPTGISIDRAPDLWTETVQLRQRLLELESEERALAADLEACEANAQELIRVTGSAADAGVAQMAAAAVHQLEEAANANQERQRLTDRLQAGAGQLARLLRLEQDLVQSARHLVEDAGCSTEEAFQRHAQLAVRYRRAAVSTRELVVKVEAVSGMSVGELRERIGSAGGRAAILDQLNCLKGQLQNLEHEGRRAAEQRGEIRTILQTWENDGEISALRTEEEAIRSRIIRAAAQYAVERVALALLLYAQRRYENEQQPRVVKHASILFRELTQGRYAGLYASPQAPGTLFVRDDQGREWSAEQLSRGTREQLYLAFRFAVVEDFAESRQPLPILVDDILVNFDPDRTASAIAVLARLAQSHQIIAFSCHPSIRRQFERQSAEVQEIAVHPTARALESA